MRYEVDVLELIWTGPHSPEWVIQHCTKGSDHGIYQVYGTHAVLGSDALLYIGKAQDSNFSARIGTHNEHWFDWEPNALDVYLGRFGSTVRMTESRWSEWGDEIDRAERLLISQCTPPYNSKLISGPGTLRVETLVLNHKRRHRLPFALSSFAYTSKVGEASWRIYGEE